MSGSHSGLPSDTRIGSAALAVEDVDRLVGFYRDVIGLHVVDRSDGRTVLGAGDDGFLELIAVPDAPAREDDDAGLFHLAFRVPSREALGDGVERIRSRWRVDGAADHVVSEALYCTDPEGNGVELYRDRPRSEWLHADDGSVQMATLPLDIGEIGDLACGGDEVPSNADLGHVHLEVTSLSAAREWYVDGLGLGVRANYGESALFLAAGDYHHHLGLNTWNDRTEPASGRGIDRFDVVVPDRDALGAVRGRLNALGCDVDGSTDALEVTDPDGIGVRVVVDD